MTYRFLRAAASAICRSMNWTTASLITSARAGGTGWLAIHLSNCASHSFGARRPIVL